MSAEQQIAVPLDALDEIVAQGERSIRTVKHVRSDEPYFAGHYPQHPIFPGVFLIEAAIQATRAHLEQDGYFGRLVEVVSTRFLAPVQPGDTLEVECELAPGSPGEFLVKAVCLSGATKVANIKLRFQRKVGNAESP